MTKCIRWNENLSKPDALFEITKAICRVELTVTSPEKNKSTPAAFDANPEWSTGQVVVCPTYAGGNTSVGECVFTNPAVQHAILSFFGEISQDPENYCNPDIKISAEYPQPTPDSPLLLSGDNAVVGDSNLPPEMTPEQADLTEARNQLINMRIALDACPENVQTLEKGRDRLVRKIQQQETKIEDLEKKALASGGLKAGEAQEKRVNWKPQKEGPKVQFAGTMVDSELLKAAGMFDTAESALEKLEAVDGE